MKQILSIALVALAMLAATSCNGNKTEGVAERNYTPDDSVSAAFGEIYGYALKNNYDSIEFTRDFLIKGLKSRYNTTVDTALFSQACNNALKADSVVSPQGLQEMLSKAVVYLEKSHFTGLEKRPEIDKNRKAGEEFVAKQLAADNALKFTPTGLIYKVEKPGNGKTFKRDDAILVRYKATHTDGSTFDETGSQIRAIHLRTVIPGFAEALMMMSPGEKLHVIIPPHMAYGIQGQGSIKPNETLIYDIEAVEIK